MTYWGVYSYLKRFNGKASIEDLEARFPDVEMIIKGISEYNDMARSNSFYDVMKI